MASVASQLIEEVTAHVQRDSLEDVREICADGTYFLNTLHILCAQSKMVCKAIGKFCPKTGYGISDCDWRYSSTLHLSTALNVIGWSTLPLGRFTPVCGSLGGLQGRSGWERKMSPHSNSNPEPCRL